VQYRCKEFQLDYFISNKNKIKTSDRVTKGNECTVLEPIRFFFLLRVCACALTAERTDGIEQREML
jgi:hypothetical protein